MLKYLLVAGALMLAGPAHATDVTTPVRAIMDVATGVWSGADSDPGDYFDEAHIGYFSKDIRALYTESLKHPAYDSEDGIGSPFDYDPIILGQDSCPLEGLAVQTEQTDGATTDVVARFKRFTCMEDSSEEERDSVSELHFQVVRERGRPVIADIVSGEGDDRHSLADALREIVSE